MSPLEEFESILKDVVQAKRLSASKMHKLTEIALKLMQDDTQLVSILYRTHKSLPATSKVSSLYVFDALARAARHKVEKQGLVNDSQIGNCATFLQKIEGVVEGLFQDMLSIGSPEAKDKTKKILDIWVKGNIFPKAILSRLSDVLKETEKEPELNVLTPTDPRIIQQTGSTAPVSVPTLSTTPSTSDPHATLLALLAQAQAASTAVSSSSLQTNVNTAAPTIPLDAVQLAIIQQLAQTAAVPPSASLPAPPVAAGSQDFQGVNGSLRSPAPHRDERNLVNKESRHDRYRSPENGRAHSDDPHPRDPRGGIAGRGRGRRWDERDRDRYRDRERDRSPLRRGGRSRSRSPPSRYGACQEPYSPPRKHASSVSWQRGPAPESVHDSGKDEFGRDIRPSSPESNSASLPVEKAKSPPLVPPTAGEKPPLTSSPAFRNNHDPTLSPSVAANTSSNKPIEAFVSSTVSPHQGMEKFDLATFDFTSPLSWEALGKMWQVTHGYAPTTEQLMQFVMGMGTGQQAQIEAEGWDTKDAHSSGQVWGGSRGARGGFYRGRARGGFTHGKVRNVHEGWGYDGNSQPTDAIVLGGGSDDMDVSTPEEKHVASESNGGGLGGRMQRIGDKWVFVRDQGVAGIS